MSWEWEESTEAAKPPYGKPVPGIVSQVEYRETEKAGKFAMLSVQIEGFDYMTLKHLVFRNCNHVDAINKSTGVQAREPADWRDRPCVVELGPDKDDKYTRIVKWLPAHRNVPGGDTVEGDDIPF